MYERIIKTYLVTDMDIFCKTKNGTLYLGENNNDKSIPEKVHKHLCKIYAELNTP